LWSALNRKSTIIAFSINRTNLLSHTFRFRLSSLAIFSGTSVYINLVGCCETRNCKGTSKKSNLSTIYHIHQISASSSPCKISDAPSQRRKRCDAMRC
jgi:hypothetical protein